MALFTGKNTLKPDSRSRIGALQIGEHESPAEDWITDPTLPIVLKNPYGGPGMEDVVIPMGRLVAVSEPVKAYTGKFKTVLTLANGVNPVVGVAPYNYVKDQSANDQFGGNKPAIITDKYIRLPYIPGTTESNLCPWGHVTGDGITVGDYLKSTAKGQFTKWDPASDSLSQRVGQILAKDFNQEMMGWLKMAMWEEQAKYADETYQNYYAAKGQSANGNGIYGGMPATGGYNPDYRSGTINMQDEGYMSQYQTEFHGIPGLTDGAARQLTRFTGKALGAIPAATAAGTTIIFQLKDETGVNNLTDLINSTDPAKAFVLKVNGVVATEGLSQGQYQVNYKTGQISYISNGADAGQAVTADYCAHFYGTNSYIDFKGAIGVFNVLLKL